MRYINYILIFSFLLINFSYRSVDAGTFKGKVIDIENKRPIAGARVVDWRTSIGTTTGSDGIYIFSTDFSPISLMVKCYGYDTKLNKTEYMLDGDTATINFELKRWDLNPEALNLPLNLTNLSQIPENQKILFEICITNMAIGYVHMGFYIDSKGQVFSYNLNEEKWDVSRNDAFTEAELMNKFKHNKKIVAKIDSVTILNKYNLINLIDEKDMSEPVEGCNDAGITRFMAYYYSSDSLLYKPILLYMTGISAQKNLSPAGIMLFRWLYYTIYGNRIIWCGCPGD